MFKSQPSDPGVITLSLFCYRLLLLFFPARFRREYGHHMAQVFRDCCLKTYRMTGFPGMFSLWVLTLFDFLKTVIEENLERGTHMTSEKFIRLSGLLALLGGLMLGILYLADPFIHDTMENIYVSVSVTLMGVGLVGVYLKQKESIGMVGLAGFSLALAGFAALAAGIVVSELWGLIFLGAVMLIPVGLVFFGAASLRAGILPKWSRSLLLLMGLGGVLGFAIEIMEQITDTSARDQGLVVVIVVLAIGWVLLGATMATDNRGQPKPV